MNKNKNKLIANIDRKDGNIEIAIASKYSEAEATVRETFLAACAMKDTYAVDTSTMDDEQTVSSCASAYDNSVRPMIAKVEANVETFLASLDKPLMAIEDYAKAIENYAIEDYAQETFLANQETFLANQETFLANQETFLARFQPLMSKFTNSFMAGLTDRQKKNLPPALRKAIVKKMESEGKITPEESKAMDPLLANMETFLAKERTKAQETFLANDPLLAEDQDMLSKDDIKKDVVAPQDDIKVIEKPKS
tara:strand:+ start:104 stop:859 length:756 start_codon:yes stop_codon:yes gene_type:complete